MGRYIAARRLGCSQCGADSGMVNYKRVVCVAALLATLLATASAAPHEDSSHYDQRQNGTENYRLNIDGLVIAVAPADSLIGAASNVDLSSLLSDFEDYLDLDSDKPKPPHKPQKPIEPKPEDGAAETTVKPAEGALSDVSLSSDIKHQKKEAVNVKSEKAQRLKNRLAHILIPLLRKTRHH